MKLKREPKVGTQVRFKWFNEDRFTNPNAQFVIKEGIVYSNTCLNDVIIHAQQENAYYCVLIDDVVNF